MNWYVTYWLKGDSEPREHWVLHEACHVLLVIRTLRDANPGVRVFFKQFRDANDMSIVKLPIYSAHVITGELDNDKATA